MEADVMSDGRHVLINSKAVRDKFVFDKSLCFPFICMLDLLNCPLYANLLEE